MDTNKVSKLFSYINIGTNMEKKVSDYFNFGNLQLRKWQTIEAIGNSLLDVLRWESPQ